MSTEDIKRILRAALELLDPPIRRGDTIARPRSGPDHELQARQLLSFLSLDEAMLQRNFSACATPPVKKSRTEATDEEYCETSTRTLASL